MYLLFGIILVICIFSYIFCHCRIRHVIRKIRCMDCCEKLCLLEKLIHPFGFSYDQKEDIITSHSDAWQRNFGYHASFDRSALRFNMVFDCEPVYFNYDGRTWLIEFWKGQYGINIGSEIGIYYADSILSPDQYQHTLFKSVPDDRMLPLSMELLHKSRPLFAIHKLQWWLAGFRMGAYCRPKDLILNAALSFPNDEMLESFLRSLLHLGYREPDFSICGRTVTFTFDRPHTAAPSGPLRTLYTRFAQWKNRRFIRIYHRITRPFTCTLDQLLFLYFLLPFAFRHTLDCKRNRKQKAPKSKSCRCPL